MSFKIIKNLTLQDYNSKYSSYRYLLCKFSKTDVNDFYKKFSKIIDKDSNLSKDFLLEGRAWCLINDTYYEIPTNRLDAIGKKKKFAINNIKYGLTLAEYNKKFKNNKYILRVYSKKDVDLYDMERYLNFHNDKQYNLLDNRNFLLKDSKWCYIDPYYYELPTRINRSSEFRLNIKKGITLSEYSKKYRRNLYKLLKFKESEVYSFDEKFNFLDYKGDEYKFNKNRRYLLKGRRWYLINDTYYERPRTINTPTKVALIVLLLGGVTFGTLAGTNVISFKEETYTISFDCDGGLIGDDVIKVIDNKKVIEVAPTPKKQGYKLEGWYKTRIAKTNSVEYEYKDKISFPYTLTANTTLYCKWEKSLDEFVTVTFNTNGGKDIDNLKLKKNSTIEKLEIPVKQDYEFLGWYYDKELSKPYDSAKPISESITLYASWKQNAFTITFDTQGGSQPEGSEVISGETNKYKISHLKTLDFEPITKKTSGATQLAFKGWKNNGEFVTYPLTVDKDMTLVAEWGNAETFDVTFDAQGGTEVESLNCSHISSMPQSTRQTETEGYILEGWKTSLLDTDCIDFSEPGGYIVTKNQTLYASWKQSEFVVNLHYKDETGEKTEIRNKVALIKDKPNSKYVLKDHNLEDWYYDSNFSEKVSFPYTPEEGKLNLYAKYVKNAFTVEINSEDTVVTSYKSITNLSSDLKPNEDQLKRSGYKISGYHVKNSSGTKDVTFNNQAIYGTDLMNYLDPVNDTLTIYVDWEQISYKLTLKYNDKCSVKEKIIENQVEVTIANLPTYTYDDFEFDYWSYDSEGKEKVTEKTITLENDNTVLYANYKQSEFTITLEYYAGTTKVESLTDKLEHVTKGTHNQNILPKTDTIVVDDKTYSFNKWTDKDDKELAENFDVTSDITLHAQYSLVRNLSLYYKVDGESGDPIKYKTLENQYVINVDSLPHLDNPDYSFVKFVNEAGEEVKGTTTLDKITNDKLIAVMTHNYFTVTLDTNGGTILNDKIEHVSKGSLISESMINTPSKSGHTFKGWCKDSTLETKWDFTADTVTQNLTLYAKWQNDAASYTTVNFKISDTDYAAGAKFKNSKGETIEGQLVTVNDRPEVSSADYGKIEYSKHALTSWIDDSTKKAATFPLNSPGNTYNLTASFVELSPSCSVQFNANGGTFDDTAETSKSTSKSFTADIDSTFAQFKKDHESELNVTLDGNHEFVQWEIYDPVTKTYSKVEDNYVFQSNVFFYARYQDKIEPKGETTKFATTNWATVCKVADDGGIDGLVDYFPDVATYYSEHSSSLLGLTKTINTTDGKSYDAVVIGEKHDYTDKDNQETSKTALTFQFKQALAIDSYAPSVKISKAITNRWETSIPRSKISSTGEYGSLIDSQIINWAQTVYKQTMKGGYESDYGSYVYTQDKFFLLSGYELNFSESQMVNIIFTNSTYKSSTSYVGKEGTPYEIFTGNDARIRYKYSEDTNADPVAIQYWIRSPYNSNDSGWSGTLGMLNVSVLSTGALMSLSSTGWHDLYPDNVYGFVPAFAIGKDNT